MSRYAKNYLPIMFNIYTGGVTASDSLRQALTDTVRCYLEITSPESINVYLDQAVQNYLQNCNAYDESIKNATSGGAGVNVYHFAKYNYLDLIEIMVVYADLKNLTQIYDLTMNGIDVITSFSFFLLYGKIS